MKRRGASSRFHLFGWTGGSGACLPAVPAAHPAAVQLPPANRLNPVAGGSFFSTHIALPLSNTKGAFQ